MVGRPQQRSKDTRAKILAAARAAFAEDGFEATSAEAVAQRAGVSKATVFAHFGDKTGLLIASKIDGLGSILEDMRARAGALDAASGSQALADVFLPLLALYREDPEFARLFLVQSTLKDGPWTRQFLDVCASLEDVASLACTRAARAGILPGHADDPALAAQGLLAFFYHAIVGHSIGTLADGPAQEGFFSALVARWAGASA